MYILDELSCLIKLHKKKEKTRETHNFLAKLFDRADSNKCSDCHIIWSQMLP